MGESYRATKKEVMGVIARCVSIMTAYHRSDQTAHSKAVMVAEVHAVADRVKGLNLMSGDGLILGSVEGELIARRGPEVGSRLNGEFVGAFESQR